MSEMAQSANLDRDFFLQGSNRVLGGVIDMTVYATDFVIAKVGIPYFFICIETAAPIEIELINGDLFTITAVQAAAYLGKWYPARIKRVIKVGSTGNFSFGY